MEQLILKLKEEVRQLKLCISTGGISSSPSKLADSKSDLDLSQPDDSTSVDSISNIKEKQKSMLVDLVSGMDMKFRLTEL